MCTLPNRKFRLVGNPDNYRKLWENKESLDKFIARLKEFWDEEKQRWKTDEEIIEMSKAK